MKDKKIKRLRIRLFLCVIFMVFTFSLAVTVRTELWAQIFVGGCLLYCFFIFVLSVFMRPQEERDKCVRRFDIPKVSSGDVVYDLQEYADKLPTPEILKLVAEEVSLYVAKEDGEAFYHINGRIFPVDEFMKTWCLDETTAEDLAYGLRKDW